MKPTLEDYPNTMNDKKLPAIVDAATFIKKIIKEPLQVICGVLHQGSKLSYVGPSKAFKTWVLIDLALAVATGLKWFDILTTAGKVLYLNFELQDFAIHKRLLAIADDRRCAIPANLHLWNLRGYGRPLSELLPELKRQIEGEGYSLIIPDPIYKTLAGRNENDAGDIGGLCGEIEAVAVETGAAVAFGAHFAKGNAAGKESIDRVSGSGVWARDPDAIITATTHEQDKAFTVDMTLRNFPPQQPFVIRWQYPRMIRDPALDPTRLKQPRNGRTLEYSVSDVLKLLTHPMTATAWQKVCMDEGGISAKTFYRRKKEANTSGTIVKDGKLWRKAK